jgi:hypothetical protein
LVPVSLSLELEELNHHQNDLVYNDALTSKIASTFDKRKERENLISSEIRAIEHRMAEESGVGVSPTGNTGMSMNVRPLNPLKIRNSWIIKVK